MFRSVFVFVWFWLCLGIILAGVYPFQFKPFRLDTSSMFCVKDYYRSGSGGENSSEDILLTNHVCFVAQQLYRTRTLYANHAPITLDGPWGTGGAAGGAKNHSHHIVTILTSATAGCQLYFPEGDLPRRSIPPGTLVVLDTVDPVTRSVQVLGVGTKIWTWRLNWGRGSGKSKNSTVSALHKKKWRVITDRKYRFPVCLPTT